ncbi:MAG TPA: MmcQ/YjbR family DNA-binding protein [Phenylobacterium sp.]|nr:MmcQ/YjbR family DNA-binding protein [Phenylobacterium sp.]
MTADDFRRIALSLPETVESQHFDVPDFRVRGKIIGTLSERAEGRGVVKLTREQQEMMCEAEPAMFAPVPSAWGNKGWTHVVLAAVDEPTLKSALVAAWRNVAPKRLVAAHPNLLERAP